MPDRPKLTLRQTLDSLPDEGRQLLQTLFFEFGKRVSQQMGKDNNSFGVEATIECLEALWEMGYIKFGLDASEENFVLLKWNGTAYV